MLLLQKSIFYTLSYEQLISNYNNLNFSKLSSSSVSESEFDSDWFSEDSLLIQIFARLHVSCASLSWAGSFNESFKESFISELDYTGLAIILNCKHTFMVQVVYGNLQHKMWLLCVWSQHWDTINILCPKCKPREKHRKPESHAFSHHEWNLSSAVTRTHFKNIQWE